ncbi:MAG TPA: hypothetical protein VHP36_09995 [Chitinispirillaceae bacterium]|nr:hypothetical protein [Chitinispirillaceae bacterium]
MNPKIASLLQVHYHFRLGGVSEVIRGYSEAFSAIYGSDSFNALICSNEIQQNNLDIKIINLSECDYHNFNGQDEYYHFRDLLVNKIEAVLEMMPLPAVILCHNMTLAKNPALSSALRFLAQKKDCKAYRFFWVVHDLAEEGRIDLLNKIEELQKSGIAIKDDLYAIGAPVNYLAPGENICSVLRNSGFKVYCLPNPMRIKSTFPESISRSVFIENMKILTARDGFVFDSNLPVCYYPGRLIMRKNVLEAIMIACIFLDANLILGAPGTSTSDRKLYDNLADLVKQTRLRVAFNPFRLSWSSMDQHNQSNNPVPYLYKMCDLALSTSVSEGFGYALYEPWLFNKTLIARRPAGFIYPQKMDSSLLYEHMPVPLNWICWGELKDKFLQYSSRFIGKDLNLKVAEQYLIKNETVDFAILDLETQIGVLKKILFDQTARQRMSDLFRIFFPSWKVLSQNKPVEENLIRHNCDVVLDLFSNQRFMSSFQKCISMVPEVNHSKIKYKNIHLELWRRGFKLFFSNSGGYNENITK